MLPYKFKSFSGPQLLRMDPLISTDSHPPLPHPKPAKRRPPVGEAPERVSRSTDLTMELEVECQENDSSSSSNSSNSDSDVTEGVCYWLKCYFTSCHRGGMLLV